jgi:hypothetical protein
MIIVKRELRATFKEIVKQFSHPNDSLTDFALIIKNAIDRYLEYSGFGEREIKQSIFAEIHYALEGGDAEALKGVSLDIYQAIIKQDRPALRKFLFIVDARCRSEGMENLVAPILCMFLPKNTVDAEQMLFDVCSDDLIDTDWIIVQGLDRVLLPLCQLIPKEGSNDQWLLISEPGTNRSTGAVRRVWKASIAFHILDQRYISGELIAKFYDEFPAGERDILTTRTLMSRLKADPASWQTRIKNVRTYIPIADWTQLKKVSAARREEQRIAANKENLASLEDPEESTILHGLIKRSPNSMKPSHFRVNFEGWPDCGYQIKNHHVHSLSFANTLIDDWQFLTTFSRLQQLKISIFNNQTFPEPMFALKSLSALSFSLPTSIEIPDRFGDLKRLTHLRISQRNSSRLPASIAKLKNLVYLNIQGFDLETLPDWLCGLVKLKYLRFFSARISDLPDCLRYLPLRRIMIDGEGNFHRLPEILREIPSLYDLNWDFDEEEHFDALYSNSSGEMKSWWDKMQERLRKQHPEDYD